MLFSFSRPKFRKRKDFEESNSLGNNFNSDCKWSNKKAKNVPGTLREAVDLAKKSKILPKIFHPDVLEHYIHAAEWEQSEYDKSVNDWEHQRYFERG